MDGTKCLEHRYDEGEQNYRCHAIKFMNCIVLVRVCVCVCVVFLYVFLAASYSLYVKRAQRQANLGNWGMSYHSNALCFAMLLPFAFVSGEASRALALYALSSRNVLALILIYYFYYGGFFFLLGL